jgi:putative transcriptional regulator
MNKISAVRNDARITQAQLGAALGWSQGRISNYESGTRVPGLADSRRIVAALNQLGAACTLDDVFPPEEEQGAAAA